MLPGDTITCSTCGAQADVWITGAQHRDGWPVLVTWLLPEGKRTMVESTGRAAAPLVCRSCGETDQRAVVLHERQADGTFRVPAATPAAPVVAAQPSPRAQLSLFGDAR